VVIGSIMMPLSTLSLLLLIATVCMIKLWHVATVCMIKL
jgi:hypothetical protein